MCNQYGAGSCGSAVALCCGETAEGCAFEQCEGGEDTAPGPKQAWRCLPCKAGATKTGSDHPETLQHPLNTLRTRTPARAQYRIIKPQSQRLTCPDARREQQCFARERVCSRAQGRRGREPEMRPCLASVSAKTNFTSAIASNTSRCNVAAPFCDSALQTVEHARTCLWLSSCPARPTAFAKALVLRPKMALCTLTLAPGSNHTHVDRALSSAGVGLQNEQHIYSLTPASKVTQSEQLSSSILIRNLPTIDIDFIHHISQHFNSKSPLIRE